MSSFLDMVLKLFLHLVMPVNRPGSVLMFGSCMSYQLSGIFYLIKIPCNPCTKLAPLQNLALARISLRRIPSLRWIHFLFLVLLLGIPSGSLCLVRMSGRCSNPRKKRESRSYLVAPLSLCFLSSLVGLLDLFRIVPCKYKP